MSRRVLLFVAVLALASAMEFPDTFDVHHAMTSSKAEQLFAQVLQETQMEPFKDHATSDDCYKCYGDNVKTNVDYIWSVFKKVCGKTECPFVKKICEWAMDHPHWTTGYFLARYEPGKDAFGFCRGSAACTGDDWVNITYNSWRIDIDVLGLKDSKEALSGSLLQTQKVLEGFNPMNALQEMKLSNQQSLDERAVCQPSLKGQQLSNGKDCHCSCADCKTTKDKMCCFAECACEKCLHDGVVYVYKAAIHHAKKACETTPCPVIKQWCEDLKQAPSAGLGALYAVVEPWKYAQGYCYGNGHCKHYKCCDDAQHCAKHDSASSVAQAIFA